MGISFPASWDRLEGLTDLQPKELPKEPSSEKAKRWAWNVISVAIPIIGIARLLNWGARSLMKWVVSHSVLQSQGTESKVDDVMQAYRTSITTSSIQETFNTRFNIEPHQVTTPDGAKLHVAHFHHRESGQDTKTVIFFNQSGATSVDADRWLLKASIDHGKPINFVVFDYRGTGASKGLDPNEEFKTTNDLVVDGASVVQFVRDELGVDPGNIYFYGRSIGGAVAAKVQALDNTLIGKNLNLVSFSSIESVVTSHFGSGWFGRGIANFVKEEGYDLDAVSAFNTIKGPKMVVYHDEDGVILPAAQLQEKYVIGYETVKKVSMLGKDIPRDYVNKYEKKNHNRYLESSGAYDDACDFLLDLEEGVSAKMSSEKLSQVLFRSMQPKKYTRVK